MTHFTARGSKMVLLFNEPSIMFITILCLHISMYLCLIVLIERSCSALLTTIDDVITGCEYICRVSLSNNSDNGQLLNQISIKKNLVKKYIYFIMECLFSSHNTMKGYLMCFKYFNFRHVR